MIELYILGGVVVVVAGVVGRSVVRVVWRKVFRAKVKGHRGESKVKKTLKRFARNGGRLKNDILIPSSRGTNQIDHLLVSKHGIFVIETKNYSGIIEGTEKSHMWRQFFQDRYSEPRHFFNPILQNKGHIQALQNIIGNRNDIPIHSLVVFPDNCLFPKLPGVFSMKELSAAIKFLSSGKPVLDNNQVSELIKTIESSEISGRNDRAIHNFKAGLHTSTRDEVENFAQISAENAVRLQFSSPTQIKKETPEETKRHLLTDIYAKVKIQGKTDTIENFFEKAKRAEDGSPVTPGAAFDHFICPFTGDKFPASEANNFYQGLWITYLNKNPELVDFMKSFGVEKLGNSYRCKKVLSLYDADKDGFTQKVRSSIWYQNMARKRSKPSLNSQIKNAESKTTAPKKDYAPKQYVR